VALFSLLLDLGVGDIVFHVPLVGEIWDPKEFKFGRYEVRGTDILSYQDPELTNPPEISGPLLCKSELHVATEAATSAVLPVFTPYRNFPNSLLETDPPVRRSRCA